MMEVLGAAVVVLLKWPVFIPLMALAAYFVFKNHRRTQHSADKFFMDFKVGGHRGSPKLEPENTIPSFELAKKEGADLIEFDVSLTKDGVAVLLHDDTLDRTTNVTGLIRDYEHCELKKVNCAAKFKAENNNNGTSETHMPTMEELVQWAKGNNMKMLFDVKDADQILVDQLEDIFARYDIYHLAIVCSFFPTVVYRLKRHSPKILTGQTWRRWFFSYKDLDATEPRFVGPRLMLAMLVDVLYTWSLLTWLPSFLGVDMMLTERRDISSTFVKQQWLAGRRVCAWTVNDLSEAVWMRRVLNIPILTDLPAMCKNLH
ncbi:unnamed protein product [Bursaphelenchus okinawaensis]|uniref:GP-PDE domain-containing protein n=1 Tax=Bursaphelenchus okinawaensis TaxID=465554 RepID=A0A811JVI9_9BILA|nr:unnamed protein product [Bursaphelenchus okinawaensis]CAG9085227.1 unnamed protein product [Bursaphelenchus okinawaensis]